MVDGYPQQGLYYKQAEKHAKAFAKAGDARLVKSVINQVRLGEGERAAQELTKQITKDYGKRDARESRSR